MPAAPSPAELDLVPVPAFQELVSPALTSPRPPTPRPPQQACRPFLPKPLSAVGAPTPAPPSSVATLPFLVQSSPPLGCPLHVILPSGQTSRDQQGDPADRWPSLCAS